MDRLPRRLQREFKTIERMAAIYCREHHGSTGELCDDCRSLVQYAHNRLQHCPYQEEKPACVHCPIHCYAPHRREQVREVMRFAGPRMLLRHPILALLHQLDNLRKAPPPPSGRPSSEPHKTDVNPTHTRKNSESQDD